MRNATTSALFGDLISLTQDVTFRWDERWLSRCYMTLILVLMKRERSRSDCSPETARSQQHEKAVQVRESWPFSIQAFRQQ